MQLALFDDIAATAEAQRLHPPRDRRDFPFATWCYREAGDVRMRQVAFPVAELAQVLKRIGRRPNLLREHHYIAQCEFKARNRRAVNLHSMGLLWADIDLNSADYDWHTAERHTRRLLATCADAGIPEPSVVVWSGRGLHVKWIFDSRLPAAALPRWAAAMKYLNAKLEEYGWPVDKGATDVSRVLRIVGTCNPRPDLLGGYIPRPVFVTHEGPDYDFDYLCEWLLPYTRDQVKAFREDAKARQEAARKWAEWDENRRKAQQVIKRVWTAAEAAALEAQQSLWWHRLDALRTIAKARGGITEGQRNNWTWVVANALAWGLGSAEKLYLELPQVVREIAPSYTYKEAQKSASAVIRRLREGGREALYRLRTATLAEKLGLSDAEYRVLRAATQAHPAYNPGIMDFPKLEGLTFEEWKEEVRRRQAEGGRYSASIRATNHPEDKRTIARLMAARGMSTRAIAAELGVNQSTVVRWLKAILG